MIKTYKYRIYPNERQKKLIHKTFGCCRFVYNWALDLKIRRYRQYGDALSRFELDKMLSFFKKTEERGWLAEVNAQALQAELLHLDHAFLRFFRCLAKYPTFKKKKDKQSFDCVQKVRVNFVTHQVRIPKIGYVRYRDRRTFLGRIKTCTVIFKNGRFYILIRVDDKTPFPAKQSILAETSVGVDVGLINFVTLSDGLKVKSPRILRQYLPQLRFQQRRLDRKTLFSQNWKKQKVKVAKIHQKIQEVRQDFLNKLSTDIVKNHDTIFVEDLNIQGMMKNGKLAKSIGDASWSEFFRQLRYKCEWRGKNLITIGRFAPSSRLSDCGKINHNLKLADRNWTCDFCGRVYDRDLQAAKNIKKMGLATICKTGQGMPEEPVEVSQYAYL